MPLPPLPSYIELRSPSPSHAESLQVDLIDAENNLGSSPQGAEEGQTYTILQSAYTASDTPRSGSTLEDVEADTAMAGNAFLGSLPLSNVFNAFRWIRWNQPTSTSFIDHIHFVGHVKARRADCLENFVRQFHPIWLQGRRVRNLGVILMLARIHENSMRKVSMDHFLETVICHLIDAKGYWVLKWLACNIDISIFGARALGTAAYQNNFEVVDILIGLGADINGSVIEPHSTPHCRCRIPVVSYARLPRFDNESEGASNRMIEYLLRSGAAKPTSIDMTLLGLLRCILQQWGVDKSLFLAKVHQVVERMDSFVDFDCGPESVPETCLAVDDGDPLMESRLQVFEYLLDHGAHTCPGSPLAALIYVSGPEKLIEKLLAKTDNLNAYCKFSNVAWFQRSIRIEWRPCTHGRGQFINPLQAAGVHGEERIIRLLLQNGADVNSSARGFCGVTPLQAICWLQGERPSDCEKKTAMMELLLDHGAAVNAAPSWNYGYTALQAAASVGDVHCAKLLVSRGADLNAPACKRGGATALAIAATYRRLDMVRFLLEQGAVYHTTVEEIPPRRDSHDDHNIVLRFISQFLPDLEAMVRDRGAPPRDYHEYEAEWADDPTYKKD